MSDDIYSELDNYDMMDDQYPYMEDEPIEFMDASSQLWQYCMKPSVLDTYPKLLKLFIICLAFRVLTLLSKEYRFTFHLSSLTCGLFALYLFFDINTIHFIFLTFGGYSFLKLLVFFDKSYKGYVLGVSFFIYLFLAEFVIIRYDVWEAIRGTQMVASMKILSYAFDMDAGTIKTVSALDFFGYLFCPGSCVFGPWVSYSDYKNVQYNELMNRKWLRKILVSFILSLVLFISSVCLLEWIVPEESSIVWLVYRNAMLFRVGHYFISYISEVTSLLSGFGGNNWEVTVTKPNKIELPYSLVQVVVNWNLPMHKWLKTYVFKTTLPFGSFLAVMLTYSVSALLHGFNARLAAVLLSLGIYTYVEHCMRNCLSTLFNSCISSKPCSTHCTKHRRTTRNLIVHTANLFFMAMAIFHLAYLGVLIDTNNNKRPTSMIEVFKEWNNLNFISHWIVLATFILYIFIRLIS